VGTRRYEAVTKLIVHTRLIAVATPDSSLLQPPTHRCCNPRLTGKPFSEYELYAASMREYPVRNS
jgi:hypothetical protein